MMRIIHTADWHIGQTFFGYDRSEEHQDFLDWLAVQLRDLEIDVLLICGDVFDVTNPSAQAQRRFYRFLQTITDENPGLQVVITAGNHDSAGRLESPEPLLEGRHTYIRGTVHRQADGEIDTDNLIVPLNNRQGKREAWCMAVPYLRQGDYPPGDETEGDPYSNGVRALYTALSREIQQRRSPGEAILAMGHLQTAGSLLSEDDNSERLIIGGLAGLPADIFGPEIVYTALGHIHREQQVAGRQEVRYAGSPLPMSFAEENYRHGVILLEISEGRLCRQEKLCYHPRATLMRIPRTPKPLPEVLEELARLPEEIPTQPAPYIEVRVLLTCPEPSLRNRIEEALRGKQVRLTRILPFYPSADGQEEAIPLFSTEELTDPWKILRREYENKYHSELPPEIARLFGEALEESQLKLGESL